MTTITVKFGFVEAVPRFQPGETLECEFRLLTGDAELPNLESKEGVSEAEAISSQLLSTNALDEIQAIETSVLWRTTGKGNEDIGVHFFKRQGKRELANLNSENVHRFATVMPKSPLSYSGTILNVKWLIRVKLFFKKGKQTVFDQSIRLGSIRTPEQISVESNLNFRDAETDNEQANA